MADADVCIVGSGPGGGPLAMKLAQAGFKVVLLERGRRYRREEYLHSHKQGWEVTTTAMQDDEARVGQGEYSWPESDVLGDEHPELRSVSNGKPINRLGKIGSVSVLRVLGLGGSTLHYQALAERLHPHAFKIHSRDGVGVDWPVDYDTLAPYYKEAESILGVSGPRHEAPLPAHPLSYATQWVKRASDSLGYAMEASNVAILSQPYQGRGPCKKTSGCVRGCPSGAKSSVDVTFIPAAEKTGNLRIEYHSHVYAVQTRPDGSADAVLYFDKDGKEQKQKAAVIVLSAGTAESSRLLLNSQTAQFPDGLANSSGWVGRGVMQSMSVIHGLLAEEPLGSYRGLAGDSILRDFMDSDPANDFARGYHMEVSQAGGDMLGPNSYAGRLAPRWGRKGKDWMRSNFGNYVGLVAAGEQLPNPDNRIQLCPVVKDRFGLPVSRIRLRFGENDINMMKGMRRRMLEFRGALPAHSVVEEIYAYDMAYGGPELRGGCRMGLDAAASVVNSFGQCHDVPNLFVMDASVFPSGGTGLPSLTIEALSLRAGDYIIKESRTGSLKAK